METKFEEYKEIIRKSQEFIVKFDNKMIELKKESDKLQNSINRVLNK